MPAAVTGDGTTGAILTLDAALDGCSAGLVLDGMVVAERRQEGGRGSAALLPELARAVLAEAGVVPTGLERIVVTIGPGSFTGVRAALAFALGIGLAAKVEVTGVSVGDAMRAAEPATGPSWIAVDSRRDRVFLDTGTALSSLALDDLPLPDGPILVGGDAAEAVASRLAGQGASVTLLTGRRPEPLGIARAAVGLGRPAVPLYVDAVEARPSTSRRPAPV